MRAWLLLLCGIAPSAMAQVGPNPYPLDIERFRPHSDTYGYANTESSTTLRNLEIGVGIWGSYSQDPIVLYSQQGQRLIGPPPKLPDGLIDQRSWIDLQVGLGLFDRVEVMFDFPVAIWQIGFEPSAAGSIEPQLDPLSSGPGDLRIQPKVEILKIEDSKPVGLAVLAQVAVPTGETRSFIGEGGATFTPMAIVEFADGEIAKREYLVRGAINLGGRIKGADQVSDVLLGSEFLYNAAFAVHPPGPMELGVDLTGASSGSRMAQNPMELQPWLRLFGEDVATLTFGGGFGLTGGVGAPSFRVFAGATLSPSFDPLARDRDHDGIPNKFDVCPNIPEDIDGFEDQDGCPDEDNDQDTILDVNDACPLDPEDLDGFEDIDGCPDEDNDRDQVFDVSDQCPMIPEDIDGFQDLDGCPDVDNDQDTILDVNDACPNAPENFNGNNDQDGCPDEFNDTDQDGLTDDIDRCPQQPEDYDGFQDEDGCPDEDNDQDGIPDTVDQCPFDPETQNNYLDEDGCPDDAPSRVVIEREKIIILEKVYFEYNRAVIQSLSYELLDEVAMVLRDNPQLKLVQVEGHTDADGSESYNQKLSQRRAESVRRYLIQGGVSSTRLVARGFGESTPIDSNDTTEGKARNRRVEFTILEQE